MRVKSLAVGFALLLHGNSSRHEYSPGTLTVCVPTAPMPILRAFSDDPMPRSGSGVARLAPMPIAVLVPCYFGARHDVVDDRR